MSAPAAATPRYHAVGLDVAAQHHALRTVRQLSGRAEPPAGMRATPVSRLPLLIDEPRWVRFADRCFALRAEGLYRFWNWGRAAWERRDSRPHPLGGRRSYGCVILFRRDPLALLAALATVQVHGTAHNGQPVETQLAHARRGAVSLTCGEAARLAARLLADRGWRARVVGARRVTGRYNTYDNGHALLEFYWPRYRKWVLADTDMAHVFPAGHGRRGDGRRGHGYLGMREVAARIAAGEGFAAQPLTSTPPRIDSSEAVAGDFCGYEQFVPGFGDDAERDAWYRGMFAAPYHVDGSTQVFRAATDRIRRLLRRNEPGAEVLSPEAWAERFYPGEVP